MLHDDQLTARVARQERLIVGILLATWLAHILVYIFVVPPWQHYDEPTHFEYAALIRELGRLPTPDEYIPSLRRAIAASMIASGFYTNRIVPLTPPDINSPSLSLGIDERGHPPLYYVVVAVATLPWRDAPIITQLYVARLFSLLLAGLLFGASYLALRFITGEDWLLRYATLAVLALQPAFADIMSAVNSDVLANLVAVLCLLGGVWFLRRPGWRRLIVEIPLLLLAFNVKRVLVLYAFLLPCAWLAALPPRLWRAVWLVVGAGLLGLCAWLALQPWQLAEWNATPPTVQGYISTRLLQRWQEPEQVRTKTTYAGVCAFALETRADDVVPVLTQHLYATQLHNLAGKQVTLAARMRADRHAVVASTPIVIVNSTVFSRSVQLVTDWQLVTQTLRLPQQVDAIDVWLLGPPMPGVVWYDSLALVEGESANLPGPGEPDASFEAGLLGERAPRNLLRNAGAEQQIPALPFPFPRDVLDKLFNSAWIAAVYPQQALLLFQGFWGIFGWGERSVSPGWFMPLGLLVIASLLGITRYTWRKYWPGRAEPVQVHVWWLCLLAIILGWGGALLRVHSQPFPGVMFWSFGRYAFVALLPSLLMFVAGLRALLPRELRVQGLAGVMGFLLLYALVALLSTIGAYR